MLLPMFDGLVETNHFDHEMSELADRHYSRRTIGARQFLYSGRKLVLRDAEGLILFGWMYPQAEMRMDGQTGYFCAIFRNESRRLASEIILEAEGFATRKWGQNRFYTYVDPKRVRGNPPGNSFYRAGYKLVHQSKTGKHLLAKEPS
jgi:hypothetical protein